MYTFILVLIAFISGILSSRIIINSYRKSLYFYKRINQFYRYLPRSLLEFYNLKETEETYNFESLIHWWATTFNPEAIAFYGFTDYAEKTLSLRSMWKENTTDFEFPSSFESKRLDWLFQNPGISKLGEWMDSIVPSSRISVIVLPVARGNKKYGMILYAGPRVEKKRLQSKYTLLREAANITAEGLYLTQELVRRSEEKTKYEYQRNLQGIYASLTQLRPLKQGRYSIHGFQAHKQGFFCDYGEYILLGPKEFMVVIGEALAKGYQAIYTLGILKALIRALAPGVKNPANLLTKLNQILHLQYNGEYIASLTLAHVDIDKNAISLSSAGNRGVLVLGSHPISMDGVSLDIPLGIQKNHQYQLKQYTINHGDIWVFFSDGIVEALNAEGAPYGVSSLESIVRENRFLDSEQILQKIQEGFRGFLKNVAPQDDASLILLKFR